MVPFVIFFHLVQNYVLPPKPNTFFVTFALLLPKRKENPPSFQLKKRGKHKDKKAIKWETPSNSGIKQLICLHEWDMNASNLHAKASVQQAQHILISFSTHGKSQTIHAPLVFTSSCHSSFPLLFPPLFSLPFLSKRFLKLKATCSFGAYLSFVSSTVLFEKMWINNK